MLLPNHYGSQTLEYAFPPACPAVNRRVRPRILMLGSGKRKDRRQPGRESGEDKR
jgi:hypothetical protein